MRKQCRGLVSLNEQHNNGISKSHSNEIVNRTSKAEKWKSRNHSQSIVGRWKHKKLYQ